METTTLNIPREAIPRLINRLRHYYNNDQNYVSIQETRYSDGSIVSYINNEQFYEEDAVLQ